MVHTKQPFSAPAILKSVVEKNGYTSKTIDFNLEFNNKIQTNNLENFWQYGNGDEQTLVLAHQYADKWADQLLEHNPTWVGISVFTYTCQIATQMLCMTLKSKNKNIKIVLGGNGMGTGGINGDYSWPQTLLDAQTVDAYIKSEAEESILNLLKNNFNSDGINNNDKFTQIENLDVYPIPSYSDYNLKDYESKRLPITGSRGCVRHCTFCDIHSHWKKFVFRSGESICNEMRELSEIHQIYHFSFTDSLVNGSMKSYRDFVTTLADHNTTNANGNPITWSGQFIARPSTQMTENDWKMTKLSGVKVLSIGVETGSDRVRQDIKKKFTNKDLDFCIEMAHKHKIQIEFLMLIGYPTEYEEDFNDTLEMFTRYQKYKDIVFPILGTTVAILPRTPLYDFAVENNFELGRTENEWWWDQNPDLTLKERFRRRVLLGQHCKKLGYDLDDEKELKTMAYIWNNYKLNHAVDKSKLKTTNADDRNSQYYS